MNKKILISNFDEEWVQWRPNVKDLNGKYYIGDIYDGGDFFKVSLTNVKQLQEVELRFSYPIMATRHINESLCFILLDELNNKYGCDFIGKWTFFKVKNSDFLNRLFQYSSGLSQEVYKLQHFAIVGEDCILDIAASKEPDFILLPLKNATLIPE